MNLVQEGNIELNESSDVECSICLDELNNGEKIRVLQCGHTFHDECVGTWLKRYYTCPYCRQCEGIIECHWLSLKPYGLSWLNKFRKYKYVLKTDHIELSRKKYVYRINLHFIKHVYVLNKTITFTFGNGKKINLWIKDAYAPFTTLTRTLNELIRQRQLELRRERIQRQIHRIEQMHQAWVEPVELEENALDLD